MGKKGRGNLSRDRGGRRRRVPRRRGHHRPCSGRRGAGRCGCRRRPSQRRGTIATPHGSAAGVQARPGQPGTGRSATPRGRKSPFSPPQRPDLRRRWRTATGERTRKGGRNSKSRTKKRRLLFRLRSKTETSQARELKRSDVCGRHVWSWPRDYFIGRTSPKKPKSSAHKTQLGLKCQTC